MAEIIKKYKGVFILSIILFICLSVFISFKAYKNTQGNSLVALFTLIAALSAVGATWISMNNFDEELKPVVVWNGRNPRVIKDVTKNKYKASIEIINYGKGLAYVREIASDVKNIGIHIGTPITLGANSKGEITFLFNKNKINKEVAPCESNALAKNIVFDLYYWNIKMKCFKMHMDLDVRINLLPGNDYINFECFINNEIVGKQAKRQFPPNVIHYEACNDH